MISLDPAVAASIRERPDDDEPRLRAAAAMSPDRGELVTIQCALARAAESERSAFERRERELLAENEETWTGMWRHAAENWRWSRGFVEEIALRPSLVLPESLAAIAASEPGVRVLQLSLATQVTGWDEIGEVFASGRLSSVRLLRLLDPTHPQRGSALHWLEEGGRLVRALARAPDWPLEQLEIHGGSVSEGAIAALMSSGIDITLTRLRLAGCSIMRPSFTHLGAAGTALLELDLSRIQIADRDARDLARAPGLEKLSRLVLDRTSLSAIAAKELGKSRRLPALVELFLSGNVFGDAGAEAIASSSRLSRLSRLDLSWNAIGDAGAAALATSPHLAGLSELLLTGNVIGHPGQKRLHDRFGDRVRLDQQNAFRDTTKPDR